MQKKRANLERIKYIDTVNIHDGGTVYNGGSWGGTGVNDGEMRWWAGSAAIGTANVYGDGTIYNGYYNDPMGTTVVGVIGTVNIYDNARVENVGGRGNSNSLIITANVHDNGWLTNDGRFGDVNVGAVNLYGGTVENGSSIDRLTYFDGTYVGEYQGREGTVREFIIADNAYASNNNWGTIENLIFHENGNGILHISAFVEPSGTDMGIQLFSVPATSGITFTGIQVTDTVNLSNGRVELSLSGTVDDWLGVALWDGIFGSTAMVSGWENASFMASWEDGLSTDWLTYGQTWNSGTGYFVAFGGDGVNIAPIPEPATLAILGLGLAGLGWARRRMKK